jgi:tRNA(fMet)-specific endonuclease VapC
MFILDTDHVSLLQRKHPQVSVRVLATPPLELATTIITVEEQLRGRLDRVRQAQTDEEITKAYQNLLATFLQLHAITIMGFDDSAQKIFRTLRAQRIRIGTQDLRIASIVLRWSATLVTSNRQDFEVIPLLKIEDWAGRDRHH